MKRMEILKKLADGGIIAVIRAESAEQGLKIAEAVRAGGIHALEITMTVPGAIEIIKALAEQYKGTDVLVGAGTVLDPETARLCILAGAEYIVSPSLNPDTVRLCNRYRIPILPGIMTMKEAIEALELGVEICKVFPGSAFGPSVISAFKAPLPQGNFMPTGGVSLENVGAWISAGAVAVGTGSELTRGAKTGDYTQVTEMAGKFVEAVRQAKEKFSV